MLQTTGRLGARPLGPRHSESASAVPDGADERLPRRGSKGPRHPCDERDEVTCCSARGRRATRTQRLHETRLLVARIERVARERDRDPKGRAATAARGAKRVEPGPWSGFAKLLQPEVEAYRVACVGCARERRAFSLCLRTRCAEAIF